ncbi:MAG: hypothetical protein IKA75_01200, partial [Bacteroidaceae bacterium]|nr:hypothetical protein [Bacteroidaceae bacterium]
RALTLDILEKTLSIQRINASTFQRKAYQCRTNKLFIASTLQLLNATLLHFNRNEVTRQPFHPFHPRVIPCQLVSCQLVNRL